MSRQRCYYWSTEDWHDDDTRRVQRGATVAAAAVDVPAAHAMAIVDTVADTSVVPTLPVVRESAIGTDPFALVAAVAAVAMVVVVVRPFSADTSTKSL